MARHQLAASQASGCLLDDIAGIHGCYVSDLKYNAALQRLAMLDLCAIDENDYPLSQWLDAAQYFIGNGVQYSGIAEIKNAMLKKYKHAADGVPSPDGAGADAGATRFVD